MDGVTSDDRLRLSLQATPDAGKTPEERNRPGQFATPTGLASDVLAYADRLLEPKELANVPAEAIAALLIVKADWPARQGEMFACLVA